jgi:prepilin-type N-terminal cleavage/methylation domain-containing protein
VTYQKKGVRNMKKPFAPKGGLFNATLEGGFTLVELVVVIVILGIIALVTIPSYVDMTGDAKNGTLKGILGTMRGAIALDYAKSAVSTGVSSYPTTITTAMFQDGTIPADPFLSVNSVTTENPITFDDAGGWRYNPTTGEVRANVADKHAF